MAREALAQEVPDVAELERRGQLEILDHDVYLGDAGDFEGETVLRQIIAAEQETLAQGWAGLRTGGVPPPPGRQGWHAITRYEATVHEELRGRRILGLCSYSMRECSFADLMEILGQHGFAFIEQATGWEIVHSATELVDAIRRRTDAAAPASPPPMPRRRRPSSTPPRFGLRRAQPEASSQRLARLQRIARSLSEVRTLDHLVPVLSRDVRAVVGASTVVLVAAFEDEDELRSIARAGDALEVGETLCADAHHPAADAFRGGPLWLEDRGAVVRRYPWLTRPEALVALPLRLPSRALGAAVLTFDEARSFDGTSRALLWDIAYQIALTVERAHAYDEAENARRRAEVASESKDEFLAMLGHELRNPLAAIRNASELIKLTTSPDKVERAQAVIQRQTSHMTRLIDGLLDISRIVRGKVSIATESLDLCEVAREALDARMAQIERRGLTLDSNLDATSLWIRGDRVRLTQIIDNLLANAIDFTPQGGTLTIDATAAADVARLEIRDTGAGIHAEVLPHIFEPFRQANRDGSRTTGGLGLGLALVKGLVELHGGSVEARSDGEGAGAAFTISIPLTAPHRAREKTAPYRVVAPCRVLIVEDHADAADALCDVLHAAGHQAVVASDGERALELARRFQPDAVFCDIDLPGPMSGHDVARAIRRDEVCARAFLVALSGYGQPEDVKRAVAAGFESHLTKPIDLAAVNALLAAHCPPGET
jgi:signal transduction histidine kinase/ActR/RegA family two-component response regulator